MFLVHWVAVLLCPNSTQLARSRDLIVQDNKLPKPSKAMEKRSTHLRWSPLKQINDPFIPHMNFGCSHLRTLCVLASFMSLHPQLMALQCLLNNHFSCWLFVSYRHDCKIPRWLDYVRINEKQSLYTQPLAWRSRSAFGLLCFWLVFLNVLLFTKLIWPNTVDLFCPVNSKVSTLKKHFTIQTLNVRIIRTKSLEKKNISTWL